MQAVQSALAVRRQRSRREEARKAKVRRASGVSVLTSPRSSVVSLDGRVYFDEHNEGGSRVFSHVTMFHVGGVLILIGLMLVVTSLMPSYIRSASQENRNDLLGTGSFFVILGGILTTVSRFVSNHEEKELNRYIKGRLEKSRSGHRITGHDTPNTPSREKKSKTTENGVGPAGSSKVEKTSELDLSKIDPEIGITADEAAENTEESELGTTSTAGEEKNSGYVVVGVDSPIPPSSSTEPVLSRILEEDEVEIETDAITEPVDSTPESSLTPTSPLETQGLLDKRHSQRNGSKGSIKSSVKSLRLT